MSPDGKEIAAYRGYIDRQGTLLRTHPTFYPCGYDANGSLVYGLDESAHKVAAYDRPTNAVKFSVPIDADITTDAAFEAISGAVTDDGHGIHATVSAGQNLAGENFGARQTVAASARVSGTVFNDANGNGKRDLGELGLGLWRVYLDLNKDGRYDAGDASALTDVSGNWSFGSLAAGTYVVRIVQNTGTATTTPVGGTYNVTLASGQSVTGKLFGEKGIA
jgi:hypothetical protein